MKKLLLIGNPSVLGKNLENILKQNYHTDFISAVPKQISSISFNSYNALILDFTLLHKYSLTISKAAKKCSPNIIVLFLCPTNIPEQIILDFYEAGANDHLYSTLSSPALLMKKLDILFTNYHLTTQYEDSHTAIPLWIENIYGGTTTRITILETNVIILVIPHCFTAETSLSTFSKMSLSFIFSKKFTLIVDNLSSTFCRISAAISSDMTATT